MATRRTTMKSRTGTKLYAVRDSGGKFKDIQTYKRAHAADLRLLTPAEMSARLTAAERSVRRATHSAANVMRSSIDDAAEAGRVVRTSMKEAFGAVRRATRRIAKRFSTAAGAALPAPKPATRMARRPAAKPARRLAA
ncbi:MAG: hypothetical protein U5L03_02460 [Burkholderiaceae bacterium]|nr:hypothetical protein [Burkholderiaceae bacterium]